MGPIGNGEMSGGRSGGAARCLAAQRIVLAWASSHTEMKMDEVVGEREMDSRPRLHGGRLFAGKRVGEGATVGIILGGGMGGGWVRDKAVRKVGARGKTGGVRLG